ncbi:MAG: transcriptional repressor LexA [Treponema sp.]|jgi:repressor LexA|nr:transcriptional repressor LexA [Treponema sp.]
MKELTIRQQEVLNFITDHINIHSYPPTIREIADHFSISVKGAHDHVAALKRKERIRGVNKRSRAIEIVKAGEMEIFGDFLAIPVLGTVAAGLPILAEQNWDGFVHVHREHLSKNAQYFALTIRGDSMRDAGIIDGDTVIVQKQDTVNNGEIAVVMVDDAMTVKRYYKERNHIRLQPENQDFQPIFSQKVRIQGRVVHVFRNY